MAISEQGKQIIGAYFTEQATENTSSVEWLVDFVLLSKDDQADRLRRWAQAKRTEAVTAKAGLEAQRASAEAQMVSNINDLDAIITDFT